MKALQVSETLKKVEQLKYKIGLIKKNLDDFKKQETKDNNVAYITGCLTVGDSFTINSYNTQNTQQYSISVTIQPEIVKELRPILIIELEKLLSFYENELESLEI